MDSKKLMAMLLCSMVGMAQAGEKEEMLKLRNTTTNLIKELVKQGVLTAKAAEDMIKRAEADAEQQVAEQAASQAAGKDTPAEPGEVRVPYVPEFIKDELRKQVRSELRADVVKDVMQEAKTQKWGVPDALPDWISRFKLSGDMRLRSQNDFMGDQNLFYYDSMEINNRGGISAAGKNGTLNTTEDVHRFRERFRLALDVKVAEGLKAGVRLATSNLVDPVSTNQTLGNSGGQYQFNVDRAFLKYDAVDRNGFKWLTLTGGRMANPWYVGGGEFTGGSEMVWDTDLSFEGFTATVRHSLGDNTDEHHRHDDAHTPAHTVFATAGVFPLQESAFTANDKWLFGSQVGLDWGFENHDAVRMGIGFYNYENITAIPNTGKTGTCDTNTHANDLSRPQFMQFGNSRALICKEGTSSNPGEQAGLIGLAAKYRIVNASASYDMAMFAPYHLILGGDFAKNIGFNADDAMRIQNILSDPENLTDATNAWQVRVDFGWPKVTHAGEWNVFSLYKYVEADAVLDAYTDSDFHLGGTNAKGWVVGANYGLMKNVWATGRWLSTDVINGPTYSNDILQLDLNTSF